MATEFLDSFEYSTPGTGGEYVIQELDVNVVDDMPEDEDLEEEVEEEEIEDIEEEEEVEEEEIEDESDDSDPVMAFANFLEEEGLIEMEEGEDFLGVETIKEKLDQKVQSLVEEYKASQPDIIKDLMDWTDNGGDPAEFLQYYNGQGKDYNKLDPDNEEHAKYIIKAWHKLQGDSDDEIEEIIEHYEDTEMLERKAAKLQSKLADYESRRIAEQLDNKKKAEQANQKAYKQYLDTVKDTISEAQDFGGIPVTNKDKREFYDYFTKPVNKEGHTKYALDLKKDPINNGLKLAYYLYKGFSFKDVEKKAESNAAKKLKERLETASSSRKNSKSTNVNYKAFKLF